VAVSERQRLTNSEAAARLGCSITTARTWHCGWCEQDMLSIAHGVCGAIYPPTCDTNAKVEQFRNKGAKKRRAALSAAKE
jgi:hypothetical protein